MLAGLLHDLGEMYIAPEYGEADAERMLDVQSYQHLVVHPHVGRLLIEQLTNYPVEVARAIGEHHERLDGTGYPHCLQRDQVSPLGRLTAMTDNALAVLAGERAHLSRASVALRVVPGEFDLGWMGAFSRAASEQPALPASLTIEAIRERLAHLDSGLQRAQFSVSTLMLAAETPALKDALGLAQHLLQRLRTGWNASGLWSADAVQAQDAAEVEAVEDELRYRMRGIARAAQLRAGTLPAADGERLKSFCESLAVE
jgi:hypothetical protein